LISGFVLTYASTHCPVDRILLGERVDAWPRGVYLLSRIAHIELRPDPAEDYVENPLPIPLCSATFVIHHDCSLHMIVSRTDAVGLKRWAMRHRIEVRDPLHSARVPAEPRQLA